jgi:hypothetical protein
MKHNVTAPWRVVNGQKISGFCSDTCADNYAAEHAADSSNPAGFEKAGSRTSGKAAKILLTGLILGAVYTVAMCVYLGAVKHSLEFSSGVFLTFVTGIPLGAVGFFLCKFFTGAITKVAVGSQIGGNLFTVLLTYLSPAIVFVIMSFVFKVKLF